MKKADPDRTRDEPDISEMRAPGSPKLAVVGGAIDVEEMRLSPRVLEVPSARIITEVPVRKPSRHTFFRVHPEPAYQFRVNGFNLKTDNEREFYVVSNDMRDAFDPRDIFDCTLYVTITRTGALAVWPITDKDPETGDWNAWHRAAATVVEMAMQRWLRAIPDRETSSYKVEIPEGAFPEPQWPDISMVEMAPTSAGGADAVLVDASQVVAAVEPVMVDSASHASIEMSDAPSGVGTLTSLWQKNLRGIKAERWFAVEAPAGAVARITGASSAWGA